MRGNVELRDFDETRFAADLRSARAVIANGGFTTLAEAIRLGKPVLSIPVRHQGEQELNAAYAAADWKSQFDAATKLYADQYKTGPFK